MADVCQHEDKFGIRCIKPTDPICPYCIDHVDEHIAAGIKADIINMAEKVNRFADTRLASKYKLERPEMEFILALRAAGGRFLAEINNERE